MWGRDNGAMALARQALDEAKTAASAVALLAVQMQSHMAECSKSSERVEKALEAFRRDSQDWRRGLGERLDEQDENTAEVKDAVSKLLRGGLISGLMIALSIIGFLIAHLPIFK
jgi:hypothetical protein